jgi:hypothetical protein
VCDLSSPVRRNFFCFGAVSCASCPVWSEGVNGPWAKDGRFCLGRVLQGIDGALAWRIAREERGWL